MQLPQQHICGKIDAKNLIFRSESDSYWEPLSQVSGHSLTNWPFSLMNKSFQTFSTLPLCPFLFHAPTIHTQWWSTVKKSCSITVALTQTANFPLDIKYTTRLFKQLPRSTSLFPWHYKWPKTLVLNCEGRSSDTGSNELHKVSKDWIISNRRKQNSVIDLRKTSTLLWLLQHSDTFVFSPCSHRFPPGTAAPSHRPNTCIWGSVHWLL